MAVIVEDGTGLSNSQCYCSVDYLDAYLAERGLEHGHGTSEKEDALVIAAKDWIDGEHDFAGDKLLTTQALKFPRTDWDGVPEDIMKANAIAAHMHMHGQLLVDLSTISVNGQISSESKAVGPLSKSVSYESGSAQVYSRIIPRQLNNLLKPYLANSGGLGMVYRR